MDESFQLARELDRVVRRLDARLIRAMQAVDSERIGPIGGLVLLHLADIQPSSIQAIVERMGRDNSQMTRVIKRLELKGVLYRMDHDGDGRVTLLHLTEKGELFIAALRSVMSGVVDDVMASLSAPDRRRLYTILRKV